MAASTDEQRCDFCKVGGIIKSNQELAFRQWTDRGYLYCRATIPIGVCDRCGAKNWDDDAEAIIAEAVRREYQKLP
jgi:hypothetical protein